MDNRFPLFPGGRILKKESLWDVRDYAYGSWQLYYGDYTDGLLKGCEIRAEENELVVGSGMLKYNTFIYLLQDEVRVPYKAEDTWVSLKAAFKEDREHPDYYKYNVTFFLDQDLKLADGQIEMCRFYLRKGSWLRDTYKGFYDMATEYDTVNLIYASVAGRERQSLHPSILMNYAKEFWEKQVKEPVDYGFCFEIWNAVHPLSRRTIAAYLAEKRKDRGIQEIFDFGNETLFLCMDELLGGTGTNMMKKMGQKVIIVD